MKTIFSYITVNYAEFQFFKDLTDPQKLQYLFDIYDAERRKSVDGIDLSAFFETVSSAFDIKDNSEEQTETYDYEEFPGSDDVDRVDVMIDSNNIMIESNSLKALRFVTYKFIESGYILKRDRAIEKMFRRDKVTKYLRVFTIINQATDLCFN
jgi:hypothetical protein